MGPSLKDFFNRDRFRDIDKVLQFLNFVKFILSAFYTTRIRFYSLCLCLSNGVEIQGLKDFKL